MASQSTSQGCAGCVVLLAATCVLILFGGVVLGLALRIAEAIRAL